MRCHAAPHDTASQRNAYGVETTFELMLHLPFCRLVSSGNIVVYLRNYIRSNFAEFSDHVDCGRGSVLLWRRCDTLCTSGFVDDVTFSHTRVFLSGNRLARQPRLLIDSNQILLDDKDREWVTHWGQSLLSTTAPLKDSACSLTRSWSSSSVDVDESSWSCAGHCGHRDPVHRVRVQLSDHLRQRTANHHCHPPWITLVGWRCENKQQQPCISLWTAWQGLACSPPGIAVSSYSEP